MRLRQRQALLLNLPDDGVSLLVLTGVAPFRQIAEALEMPTEEFAALFHGLPLEDNAVAARFGRDAPASDQFAAACA